MALHPNLEPLADLVGTWAGPGHGEYPTITAFDYREELTFQDVGKPFLKYQQLTWAADDGRPMHTEVGFLRVVGGDRVEFVLAQPTGQTESAEGTLAVVDGAVVVELAARVINTATAKQVDATVRRYRLSGEVLETSFDMAAVGQPLIRHLTSTLSRVRA